MGCTCGSLNIISWSKASCANSCLITSRTSIWACSTCVYIHIKSWCTCSASCTSSAGSTFRATRYTSFLSGIILARIAYGLTSAVVLECKSWIACATLIHIVAVNTVWISAVYASSSCSTFLKENIILKFFIYYSNIIIKYIFFHRLRRFH